MKRLALLSLIALVTIIATGCGGMPKPKIDEVPNAAGTTNVRIAIVASNYDSSWDNEKVKLIVNQEWLNNDGAPVQSEVVGEKAYNGPQANSRGKLQLKDIRGNQTRDVNLGIELKSGTDPLNQNVSSSSRFRWGMGSMAETDLLILAAVSRTGNNSYNIDACYAVDLSNGRMEQLLPRNK
ncbi:MAG: hypothetical protein IT462_04780 [Planctomycetes bacterium]|nr:hypothetical protein [Planctomycetota bacterium]